MQEGTLVWSAFAALGLVIVYAGPRLSRYGDVIAEKTGLEASWIGVILLALVTSLPEVATSATAALIHLPDVVFGNVFGSNLFNILIIAILDIMTPKPPLLEKAHRSNLVISSYGIKMMGVALVPLVLYNIPGLGFTPVKLFGIIDISSLILIGIYTVGMRTIFIQQHDQESSSVEEIPVELKYKGISQGKAQAMFTLFAIIIVAAGICMSLLADRIATYEIPIGDGMPIGQSLVGIILLAVVTSLPELMVSIGAVRLGAIDMAVGNVLGSNMFNMLIIGMADFFYPAGSILNRPTILGADRVTGLGSHLLVGLAGIVMLSIVSGKISFTRKTGKKFSFTSPVLFAVFILVYIILFMINFG